MFDTNIFEVAEKVRMRLAGMCADSRRSCRPGASAGDPVTWEVTSLKAALFMGVAK